MLLKKLKMLNAIAVGVIKLVEGEKGDSPNF